jgi:hypothetical protein
VRTPLEQRDAIVRIKAREQGGDVPISLAICALTAASVSGTTDPTIRTASWATLAASRWARWARSAPPAC